MVAEECVEQQQPTTQPAVAHHAKGGGFRRAAAVQRCQSALHALPHIVLFTQQAPQNVQLLCGGGSGISGGEANSEHYTVVESTVSAFPSYLFFFCVYAHKRIL
ncbi:hypothetical protein STCU_10964 [Strigomonas culicis]|uniref:Uncharacterized protein n=1 Tax=Strigomonas culicis TaxID=28005 RepID=S9V1Y3_9TRYP|nr:hypothetical protein STCU_10964 [Strigomonas culicis]|eukprot:EPY16830.1 hypothetical protein STCU_10964 [Strigomonas culicis]